MVICLLVALSLSFDFDDDDFDLDNPPEIKWDEAPLYDVIVVGSGPAGGTAALYAARAGLSVAVLHGPTQGGQLTKTTEVENFPGFKGTGPELVKKIQKQSELYGATYIVGTVTECDLLANPKKIQTDLFKGYFAKSVIIATGATAKYLGLPNEERLKTKGVSACAVCDGQLFKNKDVVVVGGGDAAVEESLFLSRICSSVTLIHRRDKLRASNEMKKKIEKSSVKIVYDSVVRDVKGEDCVEGVEIENLVTGRRTILQSAALFLAIGHAPATDVFNKQLETDKDGYFVTKDDSPETKIPGVFVCGDCADKVYRQAVTAAASGCKAALRAQQFLESQER